MTQPRLPTPDELDAALLERLAAAGGALDEESLRMLRAGLASLRSQHARNRTSWAIARKHMLRAVHSGVESARIATRAYCGHVGMLEDLGDPFARALAVLRQELEGDVGQGVTLVLDVSDHGVAIATQGPAGAAAVHVDLRPISEPGLETLRRLRDAAAAEDVDASRGPARCRAAETASGIEGTGGATP